MDGSRRGYIGSAPTLYVLTASVILAAANTGTFFARRMVERQSIESPADGALTVSESELDFGEVWLQNDFEWHIPLRNSTNARVDIENITASCSCTSVSPTSGSIEPAGVLDLTLTLNLAPRNAWQAREPLRPFAADLIVTTAPKKAEHSWQVRGTVKSLLAFNPVFLDFGEVLDAETTKTTRTLDVESYAPLAKLDVRCDDERFLTLVKEASSTRWKVEVTPTRRIPQGRFGGMLYLSVVRRDNGGIRAIPVEMTGIVVPDIHFSPSSVFLGRKAEKAEVSISSRTDRAITKVEVAKALRSEVRIVRVDTSPGESPRFRIECIDRPARTSTGAVDFTIFAEGDEEPRLASLGIVVQGRDR